MSTAIPEEYLQLLHAAPQRSVEFHIGGVHLLGPEELAAGQLGFAIDPEGRDLTGDQPGDWQAAWLVIGSDITLGDPFFIDTTSERLPVFTAMHGGGTWEPERIAPSAQVFLKDLERFAALAKGRANPVEVEGNPVTEEEREEFLDSVALESREFWEVMTETDY